MSWSNELLKLGLVEYHPGQVKITRDFDCPHCNSHTIGHYDKKRLVGWMSYTPKPYGVFECQDCFELFAHHIYYIDDNIVEAAKRCLYIWDKVNECK